jgi:hypothetical protein
VAYLCCVSIGEGTAAKITLPGGIFPSTPFSLSQSHASLLTKWCEGSRRIAFLLYSLDIFIKFNIVSYSFFDICECF